MPVPARVVDVCENLAEIAKAENCKNLSMWLKLAANEAREDGLEACFEIDHGRIKISPTT